MENNISGSEVVTRSKPEGWIEYYEFNMTPFSTTIGAVVVIFAVTLKSVFEIEISESALETTIQTILVLLSGLWIWKERYKKGGVSFLGIRR